MVINVVKSYWGDSYVVEGRAGSILVGNDGVGKVRNVVAAGYFVNAAVGIGVYVVWDLAVTLSGGGGAGSSGSGGGGGAGGWCWCLTSMVVLITLAAVPLAEHQISVARFNLVVLALPRQQRALLVGIVTVLAFFARLVLCAGAVIACTRLPPPPSCGCGWGQWGDNGCLIRSPILFPYLQHSPPQCVAVHPRPWPVLWAGLPAHVALPVRAG